MNPLVIFQEMMTYQKKEIEMEPKPTDQNILRKRFIRMDSSKWSVRIYTFCSVFALAVLVGWVNRSQALVAQAASATVAPAPNTKSEAQAEETRMLVLCKKDKTVRTIRISKRADLCVVNYTKGTQIDSIGEGKWYPFCEKIADGVRVNLEKAGYACKQSTKSGVSEVN